MTRKDKKEKRAGRRDEDDQIQKLLDSLPNAGEPEGIMDVIIKKAAAGQQKSRKIRTPLAVKKQPAAFYILFFQTGRVITTKSANGCSYRLRQLDCAECNNLSFLNRQGDYLTAGVGNKFKNSASSRTVSWFYRIKLQQLPYKFAQGRRSRSEGIKP